MLDITDRSLLFFLRSNMFTLLRGKDTERLEKQRRAPTRRRQASEAGARQQRRGGHSRSEAGAGRPPPSGRGRGRPASGGADKGRPTSERAPPKPERARRALARRSVIATLGSGYGGPETPQWAERGRARLRRGGGGAAGAARGEGGARPNGHEPRHNARGGPRPAAQREQRRGHGVARAAREAAAGGKTAAAAPEPPNAHTRGEAEAGEARQATAGQTRRTRACAGGRGEEKGRHSGARHRVRTTQHGRPGHLVIRPAVWRPRGGPPRDPPARDKRQAKHSAARHGARATGRNQPGHLVIRPTATGPRRGPPRDPLRREGHHVILPRERGDRQIGGGPAAAQEEGAQRGRTQR